MKKYIIRAVSLAAVLALIFSFAGCKGGKSDLLTTASEQKGFDSGIAEFAINEELKDETGKGVYDVDLVFPQFDSEIFPFAESMTAYFSMVAQDIKGSAEANIKNASAFMAANKGAEKWCVKARYTVTFRSDEYLNILCELNYGTGTPDRSKRLQSTCFKISNGETCSLRDFISGDPNAFTDDVLKSHLADVVMQKSVDKYGVTTLKASMTREGIIENIDLNNFYLTPEGIAIFFRLSTIADYASGVPVYNLSDDDVRGYFTEPATATQK